MALTQNIPQLHNWNDNKLFDKIKLQIIFYEQKIFKKQNAMIENIRFLKKFI